MVTVPGAAAPAAAAGATAVAAPPAAPAPLGQQLARPLFSLAAAGAGTHVVTVTVSPEALGPVTVRAHVGAHGMHVEMFAPTDAGREAVRAILPDLRRDLGGAGLQASVDLSSQNQPSDDRADQQRLLDQRAAQQSAQEARDGSAQRDASQAAGSRDHGDGARRDDPDPDRLRAGALAAAVGAGGLHRASSSPTVSIDVLA
nr:flagellar hook-length control protein FliK [Frigoribacterium sp. VKM Ac-2530]